MCGVDLLPTLCAIGNAKPQADAELDGEDLSAAFRGQPVERKRPLLWEYGRNDESFKYPAGKQRSPNVAIREGRWKLLVNADGSCAELYDLMADLRETTNLAASKPEIAVRLTTRALAWRAALPQRSETP
jgi:arylsulfatase A-like enzyme